MRFDCGEGILALISDTSIDFNAVDFDSLLSHEQRAYLKKECGEDLSQVFWRKQIHGTDIIVAHGGAEASKTCPDADAFITNEKNLPIAIRTADCVPVFIYDPLRRSIGLAHAGWKGTQQEIAVKTVQKMKKQYKCDLSSLKVILGPSIRECCYQVGEEFLNHFPNHVIEREGFLYADIVGTNRDQLQLAGVLQENIVDTGICTCCHKNYFSFRRDAEKAGRMISLMMLI
jgi:purine-nucleoside/S-methyl-5'-thioadenosine phosphorylase / adenosine deaminase